jgi:hypothetical protein
MDKVVCSLRESCLEDCGGKFPLNPNVSECGKCPKQQEAKCVPASNKPEGGFCYIVELFGAKDIERCPYLDEAVTLRPVCKQFNLILSWSVYGRVVKCQQCRSSEVWSE